MFGIPAFIAYYYTSNSNSSSFPDEITASRFFEISVEDPRSTS
jgi:hypothetical protein